MQDWSLYALSFVRTLWTGYCKLADSAVALWTGYWELSWINLNCVVSSQHHPCFRVMINLQPRIRRPRCYSSRANGVPTADSALLSAHVWPFRELLRSPFHRTLPHPACSLFSDFIFFYMYSFDKFSSSLVDSSLQHALDYFECSDLASFSRETQKVSRYLQSRICRHVPTKPHHVTSLKDPFLFHCCVPHKSSEVSIECRNSPSSRLVSALAVYATAFRPMLS